MAAVRFLARLAKADLRVFTTCDAAHLADSSPGAACQTLRRLAAEGLVARLKRGVWANLLATDLHPFEAVPHSAAPFPAYVSLHSALNHWGLLDQVPQAVYSVTPGRSARLGTPLGSYRFHRIRADLFWGFTWESVGHGRFPIAEPEKAILDALYLEGRGVRQAGLFPKLDLGDPFRPERLHGFLRRADDPALTAEALRRGLLGPTRRPRFRARRA